LAWKDGRLAFEGETLAQAASEFARYSDTRIVIDDPALAHEAITGLYQSNDPVGFARAAALALAPARKCARTRSSSRVRNSSQLRRRPWRVGVARCV